MNLIADIFGKMGRKLYYYRKDSGLEVDFVMRFRGECTLVEVKASSGNVKSTKTILACSKCGFVIKNNKAKFSELDKNPFK